MRGKARFTLYNAEQWTWVRARYAEGYGVVELEEFLGVSFMIVRRELDAEPLPRRKKARGLPPLEMRKGEFNALLLAELARK